MNGAKERQSKERRSDRAKSDGATERKMDRATEQTATERQSNGATERRSEYTSEGQKDKVTAIKQRFRYY